MGIEQVLSAPQSPWQNPFVERLIGTLRRDCLDVIRRTADYAVAYKPNSAFWEQYGPDGWKALLEVRQGAPAFHSSSR